jgi:uncharacterized protein (TIGR04255 family)
MAVAMPSAKRARRLMAFPEAERVIYKTNPLEEVICQLRFPPILRIDTETPASFQERVRESYPFYTTTPAVPMTLGAGINIAPPLLRDFPLLSGQNNHEFSTRDRLWTLTLNRESLTVNCKRYICWEEFRDKLRGALTTLQELYSPGFFVRTGLRYRNLIRRSRLGLTSCSWSELLQPWILGAYSAPAMRDDILHNFLQMVLRLPHHDGRVLVSSGTVTVQAPNQDRSSAEECYLVDADFFTEQHAESANVLQRLNFLNEQSDRFFHWCITKRLDDVLRAQPMDS